MNKLDKKYLKEVSKGMNPEQNLPKFATDLSSLYNQYALLELSMEYFSLHEMAAEQKEMDESKEQLLQQLQSIIKEAVIEQKAVANREQLIAQIHSVRNVIMQKMDVLTMYTDLFQVYEYVLNRKELTYETAVEEIDEAQFKQQLATFIFGSKDNFVINEYIKETVGQLPVRITKSKYFDLVKDSLSIYKGQDKASVDTYIYMLKTSAMLYKPEGVDTYYKNLSEVANDLRIADYKGLQKSEFLKLTKEIKDSAEYIGSEVDFYFNLQSVVNYLYTYLVTLPYATPIYETLNDVTRQLIQKLYDQFEQHITDQYEELEALLVKLEGYQETISNAYMAYESLLSTIKESQMEIVEATMQQAVFSSLFLSEKLLSTSSFIDLNQVLTKEEADEVYIETVTKELLEQLENLFRSGQQCVNRAVMANTLNKMPVFFNNTDEVLAYIDHSLEQCKDKSEKIISMRLLMERMEEERAFR